MLVGEMNGFSGVGCVIDPVDGRFGFEGMAGITSQLSIAADGVQRKFSICGWCGALLRPPGRAYSSGGADS